MRDPEVTQRALETRRARGYIWPPNAVCTKKPDCKCGRHWVRTDEFRANQAELMRGREITWGDKIAETVRGTYRGNATSGRTVDAYGYVLLSGIVDHPLAQRGTVREHRFVLYNKIGPGPHVCHWIDLFNCGRTDLDWTSDRVTNLHVDHLNFEKVDNREENLVPTCLSCNLRRRQDRGYAPS